MYAQGGLQLCHDGNICILIGVFSRRWITHNNPIPYLFGDVCTIQTDLAMCKNNQ